MIEPAMYGAIGFLIALLFGLMLMPLVHHRAVRLTRRRLESATPLSLSEIQADKDQLRAEFAMTARRLELNAEQLRNKAAIQAADLGKKTDAFNRMRIELEEKNAAIAAFEGRVSASSEPPSVAGELRAMELALARRQVDAAGATEAFGDAATETRRAELTAAHARAEALTRRVGEVKEEMALQLATIGEREATIEGLRQSLDEAQRNLNSMKQENTPKAKRSAMQKLRAEKAASDQQMREAQDAQARAMRELSDARQEMETARAAEREESSLLRERINAIAAEVATLALAMEGPNGAIGDLLAAAQSDADGHASKGDTVEVSGLAGRIRALQSQSAHGALSA